MFAHALAADVRQRIEAWADDVAARLRELGCDTKASWAPAGDGENRVVLAPAEAHGGARAWIALRLAEERVEVAVELAPTEVDGARRQLSDPVRALELTTALQALPEQFTMGVGPELALAPVASASTDPLRALLERAEREQQPLRLGWSVSRETAVAHAALLDELLEDAAVALGSLLVFLASPAEAPGVIARRPASGRRERADRGAGDEERPAAKRRAKSRRAEAEPDEPGEGERDRSEPPAGAVREALPSASSQRGAAAKASARSGQPRAPARGGGFRHPRPGRSPLRGGGEIEKGAQVRVLEGPFAGKVGVVQELDGKGGARVMLGLLAVRIAVEDLARSAGGGRGRPLLSSSHRKPLPVRS
ncbi:MAG: KOW motif-containing protein [Myxococcales bacterium]|nr:KOW motif-containing protein [Myxococcales bacterium]